MIDDPMIAARLGDALAAWQNLQIEADRVSKDDKEAKHQAIAARDRAFEELKTARELCRNQTARMALEAALLSASTVRMELERNRHEYEVKYRTADHEYSAEMYAPDDLPF